MPRRSNDAIDLLVRQFETAWKLAWHHLEGLDTAECLWRPASRGMHVDARPGGRWIAHWPETEGYELGPPSIAWLTWHIGFWWSMVLDHSFGAGRLVRENVLWPGSAESAREWIAGLHDEWQEKLDELTGEQLRSRQRTRWPIKERPFGDVVAWVNLELMKNASEIGYVRFLHASRVDTCSAGRESSAERGHPNKPPFEPALIPQTPSCDEYIALRAAAGLSPRTVEAAERGLPNTLYSVCIRTKGELVGMGRIIGDGGCNYEIVDVAVHPDYQRQRLGYRIMESLMGYLRANAPESAYVSLIADHGAPALYRKFGFEFTAPSSVGMAMQL